MNSDALGRTFLDSVRFRYEATKLRGEKALEQLTEEDLHWQPTPESNSVAVIVKHLHGNMISRWTDFLTTDGEKSTRDRDGEFEEDPTLTRAELLQRWEAGWRCTLSALAALSLDDLSRTVTIRGQELGVVDVILRQLEHYGYHVGQMLYVARMRKGAEWKTPSIPRGQSKAYRPLTRD